MHFSNKILQGVLNLAILSYFIVYVLCKLKGKNKDDNQIINPM